jgi:hypothetical protein
MKLDSSANRTRAEVPSVPLSERTRRRSFDGIPQEGLTAAVRTVTPLGSCHREPALLTLSRQDTPNGVLCAALGLAPLGGPHLRGR